MIQKVDPFKFSERTKSNIDILDYVYRDYEFEAIYDKDSRVEKYHQADLINYPQLQSWTIAGHWHDPNLRGTRINCGQIRGIKIAKIQGSKPKPLINSCGKLQCKICFREASAIKSQNIMDHIESVLYRLMFDNVKFSKHWKMNLQFKHISLNLAPKEANTRDWTHLLDATEEYSTFKKEILDPVRKLVAKYFVGSIIIYHPRRFVDQEKREKLYFSPHFHVIGIGYLPKLHNFERRHSDFIFDRGINYSQFSYVDARTGAEYYYLPSKIDIRNVIKYCLTHSGLNLYQQTRKTRQTEQERSEGAERTIVQITASHPAYFYTGVFSPQYYKVVHDFNYKISERDEKGNNYYELLEGFVLKAKSSNGFEKILTPKEIYRDDVVSFFIDSEASIHLFWDQMKFGNRLKINKRLKVLLRVKIYRKLKSLHLSFFRVKDFQ